MKQANVSVRIIIHIPKQVKKKIVMTQFLKIEAVRCQHLLVGLNETTSTCGRAKAKQLEISY